MARVPFLGCGVAIVGILASAAAAGADPVQVTAGTVIVRSPLVSGTVAITGEDGFSLTAGTEGSTGMPGGWCLPCLPGETISLSSAFSGLSGTATYAGEVYSLGLLGGGGAITLTSPAFALPAPLTFGPVTFEFPFTASGFVNPWDPDRATIPFVGSGRVFGFFSASPLNHPDHPIQYSVSSLQYEFESAAPTPEPGTLFLLGSGLAALLLRRRLAE